MAKYPLIKFGVVEPAKVAVKGLETTAFPAIAFGKAAGEALKKALTKENIGKFVTVAGRILKTTYAFVTAPKTVRRHFMKYLRFMPNLRMKLINLWAMAYPDVGRGKGEEEQFVVVVYSPTGNILARTNIGSKEMKMLQKAPRKPGAEQEKDTFSKQEPLEKSTEQEEIVKGFEVIDTMTMDKYLDILEEEILNEIAGIVPPMRVFFDKFAISKATGIQPVIIRYRLWIMQVYDSAKNVTYVMVFDAISDEQPIEKFEYEGKEDFI